LNLRYLSIHDLLTKSSLCTPFVDFISESVTAKEGIVQELQNTKLIKTPGASSP
jgi:hypothetical protein